MTPHLDEVRYIASIHAKYACIGHPYLVREYWKIWAKIGVTFPRTHQLLSRLAGVTGLERHQQGEEFGQASN
jgi:hypothetical protein